MTPWLDVIRRALDGRRQPLDLFVRDDDAGWDDTRLLRLLDLCAAHGSPIDLAVIPQAVHVELATTLLARIERGARIGLHQHGFAHLNHEPEGRPCEFGPSRGHAEILSDITTGQARLRTLFGGRLDPFFTPPWNRCTRDTGRALVTAGLQVLSRDATATPLGRPDLLELPIRIDWFARRQRATLTRDEWAAQVAADLADADRPLGLMLHHAPMGDSDFDDLDALLTAFSACDVRSHLMREAAHSCAQASTGSAA